MTAKVEESTLDLLYFRAEELRDELDEWADRIPYDTITETDAYMLVDELEASIADTLARMRAAIEGTTYGMENGV